MKNSIIKLLALLAVNSVLISCSPKEARRTEHEGPKDWSVKVTLPEEPTTDTSVKGFSIVESNAILKADGKSVLNKLVIPISKMILNRRVLEDAGSKYSKWTEVLGTLNAAIIRIYEENPRTVSDEEMHSSLKLYEAAAFSNCDQKMNLCPNAAFFRRDPKSARVIYYISTTDDRQIDRSLKSIAASDAKANLFQKCIRDTAPCRSIVAHKYRLLAMALLLRSGSYNDQELAFSYLKHARLYRQLIHWRESLPVSQRAQLSYLDRVHDNLAETTIAYYQPKDTNSPEFRTFVENFEPWSYSKKINNESKASIRKMFEYATRCCLYEQGKPGLLAKGFKDSIEMQQKGLDGDEKSFVQMTKDILADSAQSSLFANFGLAKEADRISAMDPTIMDEYFFIVDRLFRDHIEFADAKKILENSLPATRDKILDTAKLYAKVTLIHHIVQSNLDLAKISTESTVSSELYFQDTLNKSRLISERWLKMQQRLNVINKLLGSYYKSSGTMNSKYAELDKLYTGINRNIHYFAIYPNMMMLTYYLAEKRSNMEGRTVWGSKFVLSPDTIVQQFFSGSHGPWLQYAENLELISRPMLFYAYYYSLATNSVETFGSVKSKVNESPLNHFTFFEKVIGKFLGLDSRTLDELLSEISDGPMISAEFKTVKRVCEYEMGKLSRVPFVQLNLNDLPEYTYVGNASDGSGQSIKGGGSVAPVATVISRLPDHLMNIRDRINPRILFVRTMVEMLKAHLKDGDPKLISSIEAMIAEIEVKIAHVYGVAYDYNTNLVPCIKKLHDIEEYRQYRIYDEERAHLLMVHQQLTAVENSSNGEKAAKVNAINNSIFANTRFDKITEDTYFLSKYDLLKRIAKSLETDIFNIPSLADKNNYSSSALSTFSKSRKILVFENLGIEREPIVADKIGFVLPYNPDAKAFVLQGMSYLNGPDKAFLNWWRKNRDSIVTHQVAVRLEVDLFLAGKVKTLDIKRPDCLAYRDKEIDANCFITMDTSTDQIILAQNQFLDYLRLDDMDTKNMMDFGYLSKFDIKVQNNDGNKEAEAVGVVPALAGVVLEKVSQRPLPAMTYLLQTLVKRANVNYSSQYTAVNAEEGQRLVQSNFFLAQAVNNLESFVFEPTLNMRDLLQKTYSEAANLPFQRVQSAIQRIQEHELSNVPWQPIRYKWDGGRYLSIDAERVGNRRVLLEDQKVEDFRLRTLQFTNGTENFFGTKEAVH